MPKILRQKFEITISLEGGIKEGDITEAIQTALPDVINRNRKNDVEFTLKGVRKTNELEVKDLFHLT